MSVCVCVRVLGVEGGDGSFQLFLHVQWNTEIERGCALGRSGRSLPTSSLLGPAFGVSVLPDSVGKPQPDVRVLYFSNIDARSQTEINAALHSMRVTSNQIAGSLHAMVKTLLAKVNGSATHLYFFPQ